VSYTTSPIDAGSNPTLAVAVDNIGGTLYQAFKDIDPTAGSSTPIGTDANPKRVRSRRRGTADYDSGNVDVASSLTAVTSATIYPLGGYLVNLTDSIQRVTVTDTAGAYVLKNFPLQPNDTKAIPITDEVALVGLKAGADSASAVQLRVWGTQ